MDSCINCNHLSSLETDTKTYQFWCGKKKEQLPVLEISDGKMIYIQDRICEKFSIKS